MRRVILKEILSNGGKIKEWLKNNFDIYAYFNNDAEGYAVKNAEELMRIIGY